MFCIKQIVCCVFSLMLVRIFEKGYFVEGQCWENNVIPYKIADNFTRYHQNYIKGLIKNMNTLTCLHWVNMNEVDVLREAKRYVLFERMEGGCEMTKLLIENHEITVVRLPDHCFEGKFVLHEMIHALGFDHEHQRVDRDCYVWVSPDADAGDSDFTRTRYPLFASLDKFPYDKESVMHYRRSDKLRVLDERFYQWEPLGNEEERMTSLDLWKIQFRFCGRAHYCTVNPEQCQVIERWEKEKNCVMKEQTDFVSSNLCWEFNLVPFIIRPGFTSYEKKYIKEQINKIHDKTCVHWVDMLETESILNSTSFVSFEKRKTGSCNTQVFSIGDTDEYKVRIELPDHCFEDKFVLHEIMHALGFEHEHQRLDRDCYVWVSPSAKKKHSYELDAVYSLPQLERFPYDKQSIMHYYRSSEMKALSERFYQWEPLGNKDERLTDLDLWKIEYRFCGRQHYCTVYKRECDIMDQMEKGCKVVLY